MAAIEYDVPGGAIQETEMMDIIRQLHDVIITDDDAREVLTCGDPWSVEFSAASGLWLPDGAECVASISRILNAYGLVAI